MYRKSSRIILWIVVVVVAVLVPMSIYTIQQTGNARAERCGDLVKERTGDRDFWFGLIARSEDATDADILEFVAFLNDVKPPIKCNEQNIPVIDQDALERSTRTIEEQLAGSSLTVPPAFP